MTSGSSPVRPNREQPLREATLLLELSREITSTLDLQEVLDKSLTALRALISFGGGAIQLIDNDALVAAATDPPASPEAMTVRIPLGKGISGTIAETGEPCYIPDIFEDTRIFPEGRSKGVSTGVRSYLGVPLILHGKPIGVVQIDSPEVDAFDPATRALMMSFVPTIAAAVQNAELYNRERDALASARETERLKRDFLAIVSHELRTPLTSLAGFGQTLQRHAERIDTATVSDIGERIWRASRRLHRVMSDLLDLSFLERGTLVSELAAVDIEPIIRESVHEQADGVHPMSVEIEPDLPTPLIDADRFHQVIGNLLSNARKFSPAGSPIDITARREDNRVALSVTDQGRGMAEDMHERVFERFFQIDQATTRSVGGLGIGLFLVKELCDRMGATIDIESKPEAGTCFTVSLRIA